MPALQRAHRVQERASRVGFDWEKRKQVWAKVLEELDELHVTANSASRTRREQELGDAIFALVNYARFLGVNADRALQGTIDRFVRRFHYIERALQKKGRSIHEATLKEMDALWNESKSKRRRGPVGE
jgi:uncharacterized protein YabN with tetrapyrrole methylase and pyrophosphatase domain